MARELPNARVLEITVPEGSCTAEELDQLIEESLQDLCEKFAQEYGEIMEYMIEEMEDYE